MDIKPLQLYILILLAVAGLGRTQAADSTSEPTQPAENSAMTGQPWDPMLKFETLEDLWSGFDPRRDPLEIEVTRQWEEDGGRFEELCFTGETWQDEPVRVFAYRGAPCEGENLPGILHIHGGGQTASLDWVKFWVKRGYVAVSHDFCGDWTRRDPGRTKFTRYGKLEAGMDGPGPGRLTPTPRYNAWYHWTLLARRALTLLERHPQVNPARLGVYGISVGGTLTWMVAGTDKRVKAAVPIYGCGWNSYQTPQAKPGDPVDTSTKTRRAFVESEAYAPGITCPLLFMSASNDHHGNMDRSFDTLALAPAATKRQVFTPNYIHHVEPSEGASLPLWMDWQLKGGTPFPATPALEVVAAEVPQLRVRPEQPDEVEQVEIYYALNDLWPQSRHWRWARPVRREGDQWIAPAPFVGADDTIYAYANVTWRGGRRLSSMLVVKPVKEIAPARPTLHPTAAIAPQQPHQGFYFALGYTDPMLNWPYFGPADDQEASQVVRLDPKFKGSWAVMATHALGDPQWRRTGTGRLRFEVERASMPGKLEVQVTERHWQPTQKEYSAAIDLELLRAQKGPWLTIEVEPRQFKAKDNTTLAGWDDVNYLVVELSKMPAEGPTVIRNLQWAEEEP